MKEKRLSYGVRCRNAMFRACSSSVSPGNPQMMSDVRAIPAGSSAMRRSYSAMVYFRRIRCSTVSAPCCTGRWKCGISCGTSKKQPTSSGERSIGCEVVNRMRRRPGTAATLRISSANVQPPT